MTSDGIIVYSLHSSTSTVFSTCLCFLQGVTQFDSTFQEGMPICSHDYPQPPQVDVLKALCHICKSFANSSLVQQNGAYCFPANFTSKMFFLECRIIVFTNVNLQLGGGARLVYHWGKYLFSIYDICSLKFNFL